MGICFLRRAWNGAIVFILASAVGCGDSASDPAGPQAPGVGIGAANPNGNGGSAQSAAPVTSATGGSARPVTGSSTGGGLTNGPGIGSQTMPPATAPAESAAANQLWCKAKAALDARCTACHDGQGTAGTPMGLTKHADLTAAAPGHPNSKVWERVAVRIHADKAKAEGLGVMPPKNDLSVAQLADLDAWLSVGATGSDAASCAPAGPVGSLGANGRPTSIWDPAICDAIYKLTVHDTGGGKLKVPASPEEFYSKVDVDAPWGDEIVQIINQRPISDNRAVLHHWILYDKAGPFITGWAPGDEERRPLPASVGMKVPSGRGSMYLDMHYYNRTGKEQEDASGVEVCVVKGKNLRPNPAGITMGFSQVVFSIPPVP